MHPHAEAIGISFHLLVMFAAFAAAEAQVKKQTTDRPIFGTSLLSLLCLWS